MQENIGSMEEEAVKRKERLRAWKRKHDEPSKGGDNYVEGIFANFPRLVWLYGRLRLCVSKYKCTYLMHSETFVSLTIQTASVVYAISWNAPGSRPKEVNEFFHCI
jgi:hypothetical protein